MVSRIYSYNYNHNSHRKCISNTVPLFTSVLSVLVFFWENIEAFLML